MFPIIYFYIFLTSLIISSLLVPYVSHLSVKIGGVDTPDERKVHFRTTPRLGGIAIFAALIFTVIFFCDINQQLKGFLSGAIVIFLTGLVDDLVTLTPRQKFCGELLAAGLAIFVGHIVVKNLGNPFGLGIIELGPLAIPFTLIGIVGLINAINLLDGLDGLAGGVCAIACVSFAIVSFVSGNTSLLYLSVALLGALLGFLRYNNYPANIFMGDGGSLLLGYCMGTFSVMMPSGGSMPVSPYIPLLILGVPIMDTLVVMVNRKRAGKRLFLPDKTHLHHRLLDMGVGHKYTVMIVFGITYLLNAIAIFGCNLNGTGFCVLSDSVLLLLLITIVAAVYGILQYLASRGLCPIDLTNNQSLRSTASYQQLVRFSGYLVTAIKYLLITILLLPVFLDSGDLQFFSLLPLVLFLLSVIMCLIRIKWTDMLLQVYLYGVSFLLVFALENYGGDNDLLGVPLLTISNVLFILLLLVEGIKIFVRKYTLVLIVSPFEYLIMLIVLSVPLLPYDLNSQFHLMFVAAKSVILFVGFKLVLMRQLRRNRKIMLAIAVVTLVMAVRYLTFH